jgi:dihydroorotate dehydrogenase electron transfer subunit
MENAVSTIGQIGPRFDAEARVLSHERIIGQEFEIVFEAPDIASAAQPGQFLELLFGDSYAPLLRRPFSLYRVDRAAGTCSVLYLARGAFTSGLAQKRPGDRVSLLGPLGRPYRWQTGETGRHILIAGGIGAPPLYFLAHELSRTEGIDPGQVVVVNAARTRDLLVGMTEFGNLNIVLQAVTDDGTQGARGLATELLTRLLDEDASPAYLYSCGPMPMLRAVGEIALERGVPCQLSIETSMPCGIGLCQGCVVSLHAPHLPERSRNALACVEGPVFDAHLLRW